MLKRILLIFLVTVSSVQAADRLTLMLDWFPNIDHLPIYVARQRGFLSDAGIDLEIISPSDTADALKLVTAGRIDLAVSYEPQAIVAASSGLKIATVGRLIEHPLTTLLFLKGKGIKKASDLNQKTIGYTVPGLMDLLLAAFAEANGIKEYIPVNVGFSIAASLVSGKVDAIMGPFKTYETVTLKSKGYEAGFFELEKHGIPDYDELIFISSGKILKSKEDAVERFIGAVQKGIDVARADKQRALSDYFKEVPEADRRIETEAFVLTLPYYARSQELDYERWQNFCDFALKAKIIKTRVDAKSILHDFSILNKRDLTE